MQCPNSIFNTSDIITHNAAASIMPPMKTGFQWLKGGTELHQGRPQMHMQENVNDNPFPVVSNLPHGILEDTHGKTHLPSLSGTLSAIITAVLKGDLFHCWWHDCLPLTGAGGENGWGIQGKSKKNGPTPPSRVHMAWGQFGGEHETSVKIKAAVRRAHGPSPKPSDRYDHLWRQFTE